MEIRFLLDTDIFIFIRQRRPEEVSKRFGLLRPGEAAISVITYGELFYGATKSAQRSDAFARLSALTDLLPVLPLPKAASESYGELRAQLESKGELIGNNDLWIAAHALASGLTLVTNNEKEFRRVRGLKVQNWAGRD
jgi:tRNA(fMet)-specific endonuclease VapC